MKIEIDLYTPQELELFACFMYELASAKQKKDQESADEKDRLLEHMRHAQAKAGRVLSIVKTDAPDGAA